MRPKCSCRFPLHGGKTNNMEIRAPHPNELDDMLDLMCRAFELDAATARDIFYSDPFFDLLERRVLVDQGKVISCLTIVPGTFVLGTAQVPVAGIAGVATDEAYRRRGYAAALLRDTIRLLHKKNIPFSMLYPFSPHYYRKFGWEIASAEWWCEIPSRLLPPYAESRYVRPYNTNDHESIKSLHTIHLQTTPGSFVRDIPRWQWILRQRYQMVVADFDGAIEGYMIYELQSGRNRVEVREMVCSSRRGQQAFLGFLSSANLGQTVGVNAPVYRIQHWSTWITENNDELFLQARGGLRPTYMLRITHLRSLIDHLRPHREAWKGYVKLVVEDDYVPGGKHVVYLADENGHASTSTSWVRGSVQVWSQIAGGYLLPSEALSMGMLTASHSEVVQKLDSFFPKLYPFTTQVERF